MQPFLQLYRCNVRVDSRLSILCPWSKSSSTEFTLSQFTQCTACLIEAYTSVTPIVGLRVHKRPVRLFHKNNIMP
jgi:hypothetical protein